MADEPMEPGETPQGEPASPAPEGEEAAAEKAPEHAQPVEPQPGNSPEEELAKLRPVCTLTEQNYGQVLDLIKEIKSAENVLQKFHARAPGVTAADVEKAKGHFHEAKKSYLQLGNQINDGIKQVNLLAKTYPMDEVLQGIYQVYLAKLLSSLETRNPVQPFVDKLAAGPFEFERQEGGPTEVEKQRGMTQEKLEKERLEKVQKTVNILEVRYQKRQLANRLRGGENPATIIKALSALLQRDPEDINTYIWLASLISGELKKERNQNKRIAMRDGILDNCQKAFSIIDDSLNLQGIENLNERDKRRSEYVKTITSIRKPLLDGGD
ncbi:MAG: hypothetical protein IIA14_03390 [SAR324 cluster bacterium]|nr:hypothetical protein [SAR324 cluster bacterium]